jgi:hypothetical protein
MSQGQGLSNYLNGLSFKIITRNFEENPLKIIRL